MMMAHDVVTHDVMVNHVMMDHVTMMMNNGGNFFVLRFLSESESRRECHRRHENSTGDDFLDHC